MNGRLLFVPISGPRGMGEYARALAIATAAAARWPQVPIHFALSRAAPYISDTPFSTTLLPSSPTFHTREVKALIAQFRPSLVVFDNAGRTAQLRAAREVGAHIVFVSSRMRQRRKAFRLRWMRMLEEHWIAYPEIIAGSLGAIERLKQKMLGRPQVRYLDVIVPPPDPALAQKTFARQGVRADEYVLVVPGGGTDHRGAENAPQIIAEAARRVAERGVSVVLVGIVSPGVFHPMLRFTPRMPMAMLVELMRGSRLVISNGGDTLLQALACKKPCVAVPIAGDQPYRIRKCVQAGVVVGARLDVDDIESCAMALLQEGVLRRELLDRLSRFELNDGVEIALSVIERLHQLR